VGALFLIFGGRSPIALSVCDQLVKSGAKVHLASRKIDENIQKISRKLQIEELHEIDLRDTEMSRSRVRSIVEANAELTGLAFIHRYRELSFSASEQHAVEVLSPFQIIEDLSQMSRTQELAIVLTTSPAADHVVSDQSFYYHASKAATNQIVRYSAVNFAKSKLRTNGVNPGTFVFKDRAAEYYKQNPQIVAQAEQSVPLGRMASVSEIASVFLFLLSPASSFVNGQIINVDGGISSL